MVVLVAAAVLAAPARSSTTLERRIYQSFVEGDYARAATLIEQHLDRSPHDSGMLYNAACAYSRLGDPDRAASYLRQAVESGLTDADQIARDPDLEAIRRHPIYTSLMRRLAKRATGPTTDAQGRWRSVYGDDHYRYSRDDERRIAYATALDPTSHREMVKMIERQADHLHRTLFESSPSTDLLVAVPTPHDGRRLFDDERAGGMYEHHLRRLVARDTGSSLRHELVHAMHYVHMDLVGQRHPLWIQEGVASLYESYVFEDGGIVFLHNERHNVVHGLARAGGLTPWKKLFRMSDDQFMSRASHHYPQVRSIFEYLADKDRLVLWYNTLLETFEADPTGAEAFRRCFGDSLTDIERDWRRWVLSRPPIDVSIDPGEAVLGVETRLHSSNDGVLITRVLPGSAAALSRLDIGDVIVSVDDTPTRTLAELRTLIAARQVGDSIAIRARRDREYFTVVVSLRPLEPIRW